MYYFRLFLLVTHFWSFLFGILCEPKQDYEESIECSAEFPASPECELRCEMVKKQLIDPDGNLMKEGLRNYFSDLSLEKENALYNECIKIKVFDCQMAPALKHCLEQAYQNFKYLIKSPSMDGVFYPTIIAPRPPNVYPENSTILDELLEIPANKLYFQMALGCKPDPPRYINHSCEVLRNAIEYLYPYLKQFEDKNLSDAELRQLVTFVFDYLSQLPLELPPTPPPSTLPTPPPTTPPPPPTLPPPPPPTLPPPTPPPPTSPPPTPPPSTAPPPTTPPPTPPPTTPPPPTSPPPTTPLPTPPPPTTPPPTTPSPTTPPPTTPPPTTPPPTTPPPTTPPPTTPLPTPPPPTSPPPTTLPPPTLPPPPPPPPPTSPPPPPPTTPPPPPTPIIKTTTNIFDALWTLFHPYQHDNETEKEMASRLARKHTPRWSSD